MNPPLKERIEAVAREALGYSELRPGQLDATAAVLGGADTLAIMSTGFGKSAIYQLAGLLQDGATIVVSPLISLQRDQVLSINRTGFARAAALDGSLSDSGRDELLQSLAAGELDVVFLAPEQLNRPDTTMALSAAGVSLLVIDEAHCISEWGHDFRPAYMRLGALVDELGHPTVLAMTATAAPPVRDEIVTRLRMRDATVIVRGFDRPNLFLKVIRHEHADAQRSALMERALSLDPPGLIYVATRKEADQLAKELSAEGVRAGAYHAGLSKRVRDRTQADFMEDRLTVIVATTAFGMGVDKQNVRFVLHHEPSDSLDSYYQEIGRAGRDRAPAEATLFYRSADIGRRRFYAASGVDAETIGLVAERLARRRAPLHASVLKDETGLSETKVMTAIGRLEDVGAVTVASDGTVDPAGFSPRQVDSVSKQAAELEESRRSFRRSRLEMMRGYAETVSCRRAFVLSYFGEPTDETCENCDNCRAEARAELSAGPRPFAVGESVQHSEWGRGSVQRYDADIIVVLFDTEGYRTLDIATVRERGLLSPVDRP